MILPIVLWISAAFVFTDLQAFLSFMAAFAAFEVLILWIGTA